MKADERFENTVVVDAAAANSVVAADKAADEAAEDEEDIAAGLTMQWQTLQNQCCSVRRRGRKRCNTLWQR